MPAEAGRSGVKSMNPHTIGNGNWFRNPCEIGQIPTGGMGDRLDIVREEVKLSDTAECVILAV
jgi:hypothetical protein